MESLAGIKIEPEFNDLHINQISITSGSNMDTYGNIKQEEFSFFTTVHGDQVLASNKFSDSYSSLRDESTFSFFDSVSDGVDGNGLHDNKVDEADFYGFGHSTYDSISNISSQQGNSQNLINRCDVRLEDFESAFKVHSALMQEEKPQFECEVCKKPFTLLQHLRIHMHIHDTDKVHKCEICGELYAQEAHLNSHISSHTENKQTFLCKICGQAYKQLRNLNAHMQVHTMNCEYKCEMCAKIFNQMSSLKIHMNVHNSDKPFKCTMCEKSYTQLSNLKIHLNSHNGGRPFKCEVCGKAFNQISSLKTHKHGHTGDKPHKCTICAKAYTQSSSLKVHMNIHNGYKPYKCDVCEKTFSDPSNFRKHKATTHSM